MEEAVATGERREAQRGEVARDVVRRQLCAGAAGEAALKIVAGEKLDDRPQANVAGGCRLWRAQRGRRERGARA